MDENTLYLSNETIEKDFHLLTIALHSSKSGIIITDNQQTDNPIIFCNKAFEVMTGYNRIEIIGRNCRFLQGTDRLQEARFQLHDAINKGQSCMVELKNYRRNGSMFWNELYLSPIINSQQVITHFIGVQNDISERKKAEISLQKEKDNLEKRVQERTKYLKENEEYLSTIIENIRESLLVLDKDLVVISANDFFYKTFRINDEEIVGKPFFSLVDGKLNIPELKRLLGMVLPLNNSFESFEVEQEFPFIGNRSLLLNARRIEAEGAFKDRILLAIEDQTERKASEMRKDDFLSIASHELKTPLTTIKGYIQLIEMLMQKDPNEKVKDLLRKSSNYIEKLNRLIIDLLDASKIQAGKVGLHYEDFDFDKMIYECVENIQTGTKTHKIKTVGKTGLFYNGDPERLEQVLINLLTNAIKYSPDSKEITVGVSKVSNFIKVSVTDKGVGIKQEDHKKVFERFYRAQSVQREFPGMGIGLYVCEQIIKNHSGSLWVESEETKGSTFSFTLPIIAA